MPATPLPQSTRYFDVGTTRILFLDTIAAGTLIPTRSELTAGVDLTAEVADLEGFAVTAEEIETPDFASLFTSKIGGRTSADDSSLTFYASIDGDDVRTELPLGTNGYIVFLDGGDVATQLMSIYPVRVRSTPMQRSTSDAARVQIQFSITRPPKEFATIPSNA
jgi:hypothetical protein